MHFSIALTLAVTRVLAQSPSFTFEPKTVVAGELTQIKATLVQLISCPDKEVPKLVVNLKPGSEGVIVTSPSDELDPTQELLSYSYMMKGIDNYYALSFYDEKSNNEHINSFGYFSLNITTPKFLEAFVICGKKNSVKISQTHKLDLKSLDIAVTAAPALTEVVKLTPSEANSTLVSTIALNAPWPKECRTAKQPVVKLSLDAETIRDGGALSSDPQPGYYVYGLKGNTSQVISAIKTNKTIKEDKFTAIEFQRYSYALHNQLNLTFKFLGQQVPSATAKDTPLKVEFTCGNRVVKFYSNETDNAPIIKVNHAIPASIAISTFLLSFLFFFV
ncbi:hypothetical protein DSO57_1038796 [Entomophthora muscae]|uniref:Uncharacterized protein n=1 Tax=Entomophthora muscae TaxID=34485 RepID=A0ACC2TKZ2_9FUNG|nr:hypothetical protein DSO57_1038796 [Entomophthora muscae]